MNDETKMNGPGAMSQQDQNMMMLNSYLFPVMATALNGLRTSLPQVPIATLLVQAAAIFGQVMGQTTQRGAIADILKIRAECAKAFGEQMRAVKIEPEPMTMPPRLNG